MLHEGHGARVVHGDIIQVHGGDGQPRPGQQVPGIPDLCRALHELTGQWGGLRGLGFRV